MNSISGMFISMRSPSYFFLALLLVGGSLAQLEAQWSTRRSNLPNWGNGVAIDAFDRNTAVISLVPAAVYRTQDGGQHWDPIDPPRLFGRVIDISLPDTSAVWVVTDEGSILRWQNNSESWVEQYRDTTVTTFMNYIRMFDTRNGIAMGDGKSESGPAAFLRTTDGGEHWVSVNDSAFGGYSGDTWRRLDFVSPSVGYFFESGANPQKTYKTLDGGTHWTVVPVLDTLYVMLMKFYNEQIGLVYCQRCVGGTCSLHVSRTIDGGTSWQTFDSPASGLGNDIEFLPGNPSKVWMTDDSKLYFSVDTGRTWIEQLAQGGRDIVFTDPLHGWMLGDNGILMATTSGGEGTNHIHDLSGRLAAGFTLAQNYPNPFNPRTKIQFTVVNRQLTIVKVYDVLGREVATLVNEVKEPGTYHLDFDAAKLASGVYFYTFVAGDFAQTRKMLLLR